MATVLTPVQLDAIDGAEPSVSNPDVTGNLVLNNPIGRVFGRVTNANATYDCTITAVSTAKITEGTSGDLQVEDPVITIPHEESRMIGPWSRNFNNGSNQVALTWGNVGAGGTEVPVIDVSIEMYKIV